MPYAIRITEDTGESYLDTDFITGEVAVYDVKDDADLGVEELMENKDIDPILKGIRSIEVVEYKGGKS